MTERSEEHDPAEQAPAEDAPDGTSGTAEDRDDAVLLYVGGPLDGRVEVRPARHGDPLPVVTHTHLHGGPKVVHRYDLQPLPGSAGVYRVRDSARRSADAGRGSADTGDTGPTEQH